MADTPIANIKGPIGPTGPRGFQGPQGETGAKGDPGEVEEAPINGEKYIRKDAGWEVLEGGGATESEISVVAHGFTPMEAIFWDGTNWSKARANDPSTMAMGVVVEVKDADTFKYAITGRYVIPAHGLNLDSWYYVDDTVPGGLTDIAPDIEQPIVYVETDSIVSIYAYRPSLSGDLPKPGTGVPGGGNTDQLLTKLSNGDGDVGWQDPPESFPIGGTTGQALVKNSDNDNDVVWGNAIDVTEAPEDGSQYIRKDGDWAVLPVLPNRNLLINGGFDVWQRGSTFPVGHNEYIADRWYLASNGWSAGLAANVPRAKRTLLLTCASDSPFYLLQAVELKSDNREYPFKVGTKITFSGWIQGGTPGGCTISINSGFRNIASSNTNQVIDLDKTEILTTVQGRHDYFEYTWEVTGESLAGHSCYFIQLIGEGNTVGDNVRFSELQLEVGEKATPFENKTIAAEWNDCYRYYIDYYNQNSHAGIFENLHPIGSYNDVWRRATVRWPVQMRTSPTLTAEFETSGTYAANMPLVGIQGGIACELQGDLNVGTTNAYSRCKKLIADAEL